MKHTSTSYKVFSCINTAAMLFVCCIMLFPFVYVLSRSFATEQEILERGVFLVPMRPSIEAYEYIINGDSPILSGYKNTIFVTVMGSFVNLLLTSMLSYAISKKYLPGRSVFTFIIFFTMIFGGGLIPTFLVVKSTGLLNSLWAMIIPSAVSAWNTLILRNFFMSIPLSLEESARLDGAKDPTILTSIYFPISLPAIATIGLFYAVGHWNAWFPAAIYINSNSKWPLQLILREILSRVEMMDEFMEESFGEVPPPSEAVRTASTIVVVVPILCVYPFIQKYFVKGVLIGSVKG